MERVFERSRSFSTAFEGKTIRLTNSSQTNVLLFINAPFRIADFQNVGSLSNDICAKVVKRMDKKAAAVYFFQRGNDIFVASHGAVGLVFRAFLQESIRQC